MNDDRPDTPQDDEGLDPRLSQMALSDPSTGRWLEIPEDPEADRLLDAYRTGALEADERRLVETRLRREPVLRRRLARRAGLAPELPEGLRERVLDTISKKHGISGGSHGTRWLAAAALLLLGVATVLLLPARRLPPEVAYQVEVRGLAQTRDLGSGGGTAEASAGTVVRIVARPEQTLATEVTFGIYRQTADELQRVPEAVLDLERHGDAATLSVRADELIEGDPGFYTLYLVVARPGDLP
ncbi:MAG: hypothetical protein KDD47_28335, partial [Acidobacteria bacterium]|nr:hypothetical protein [Acidobacteriota bacterium]